MRHSRWLALLVLVSAVLPSFAQSVLGPPMDPVAGRVVVANRGGGTITVFNARDDSFQGTHVVPGALPAEPMYVVFAPGARRVFVGDRANDAVVAFHAQTFAVVGTALTGEGVFHMEMDERERQLWVVNDVDDTLSVFDPSTLAPLATVPLPADLVAQGGRPHDMVLDPDGNAAFVTVLDLPGADVIVRYSTTSFQETGRVATLEGAHAITGRELPVLLVTGADTVQWIHRASLLVLDSLPVVGAHGTALGFQNRFFYTSNLGGGGLNAVTAINPWTMQVVGSADAPVASPHNVAVTLDGKKLYCTHSIAGGFDVSVYDLDPHTGAPIFRTLVQAGNNPFGIAASR